MKYESDYEQAEINKVSKINSAALINLRLNKLWSICDLVSASGDLARWNAFMDSIWRNLAADANKEHLEEYEKIEDKLLSTNFFNLYHRRPGFNHVPVEETKMRPIHYRILQKKHIFLKEVENSQGKGTAYKDEFEDDFE